MSEKKRLITSLLMGTLLTAVFAIMHRLGVINIECTVAYLNPWQLFFQCSLFYGIYYLIAFVSGFLITMIVLRK